MSKNDICHFSNTEWNSIKLEILTNNLYTGDRSWNHPHVSSSFNRLYFVIHGDAHIKNENEFYQLRPGYMYLIPAGSCYDYVCTDVIHTYFLHFNLEIYPGCDLFSNFQTLQELPYRQEVLEVILAENEEGSFDGMLHLKALFWQIVYEFFSYGTDSFDYMNQYKGFRYQKHVLDYLSAHLSATLRIRDISVAMNIPLHQLTRSFSRDTGYGLKAYMEQMLLKRARQFLLYTDMSIGEISEKLGFSDPFYFSRFFKKNEQISPREYRKQKF